jgi:hypothetical protein
MNYPQTEVFIAFYRHPYDNIRMEMQTAEFYREEMARTSRGNIQRNIFEIEK